MPCPFSSPDFHNGLHPHITKSHREDGAALVEAAYVRHKKRRLWGEGGRCGASIRTFEVIVEVARIVLAPRRLASPPGKMPPKKAHACPRCGRVSYDRRHHLYAHMCKCYGDPAIDVPVRLI